MTGALQGTHGDVTPALRGRAGHPEAARIGRGIGTAAAALHASLDGELDRRPRLGLGFREVDLRTFFEEAPRVNPNAALITGVICGYRVEDIEDPLMQRIRYLDKLVDELARGKKMSSILRGTDGQLLTGGN